MTQPTPYNRTYSFTDFSASNPSGQQPGVKLDAELDAVEKTLDDVLRNLALLQRDDTKLGNATVGVDQLTAEAVLALAAEPTAKVKVDQAIADAVTAGLAAPVAAAEASAAEAAASAASIAAAAGTYVVNAFADIAAATVGTAFKVIRTLGYATKGDGGHGIYVEDATATAALYAAHPRLVGRSSNTRYFRLIAEAGAITVEQAGAVGDPTRSYAVDDQPAIQAALTYANAVGIRTVEFTKDEYTVFATQRTSDPTTSYAPDGCPLVLTEFTTLRGRGLGKARINFRSYGGGAFQGTTAGTNFQVVGGKVWRGHGIFVVGKTVDPGFSKRPGVRLERMSLQGGTTADGDTTWPASGVTGNGWDTSHKGVFINPDKFTGDTELVDSEIIGFRGEIVYSSNHQEAGLLVRNCLFGESNGQALNPPGGWMDATGVRAYNVAACIEGWGGTPGRLQGYFYNIMANVSSIQGGVYNTSGTGSYYKPQIPTVGPFAGKHPVLDLDIVVESAQKNVTIGSFLRGRIVAIDTYVQVSANETSGTFKEGVQDTDLEIISVCDKGNMDLALGLTGGTAAGSKQISRCRFRGRLERTKRAEAAGYIHTDGVQLAAGTSFGTGVVLEGWSGQVKRSGIGMSGGSTALQDNVPLCRNNDWQRTTTDSGTMGQNITTSADLIVKGDYALVFGTNNTNVNLRLPTAGIQNGHELTIENINGGASGFCFTLGFVATPGFIGPKRITGPVAGFNKIKVRYDARNAGWVEVENHCKGLYGNATIDIPSIAAGATSAVQSIPVVGCRVDMTATVSATSSDLGDNFGIVDVRCVTDAVKFRVVNRDTGAAQDPVNMVYRAAVQFAQ